MPLTADGTFRGTGPSGDNRSRLTKEYISASRLDLMQADDAEIRLCHAFSAFAEKATARADRRFSHRLMPARP
jgi:hypothetical protein